MDCWGGIFDETWKRRNVSIAFCNICHKPFDSDNNVHDYLVWYEPALKFWIVGGPKHKIFFAENFELTLSSENLGTGTVIFDGQNKAEKISLEIWASHMRLLKCTRVTGFE